MPGILRLELPAEPTSVADARAAVHDYDRVPDGAGEDLQVLVSELLTNAVRHSGLRPEDSVAVTLTYREKSVRVEVTDRGRGFDRARIEGAQPTSEGGFGLMIVGVLASEWGVDRRTGTVWAEMAFRPRGAW